MIEKIDENIFCVRVPFATAGVQIGARSTIIKLADGKLWLHSPVNFTEEDAQYIQKLGKVAYIVAPNTFHHLFLRQAKDRFPDAKIFHAPGLDTKRKRFQFDGAILDQDSWSEEIDQILLEGMPKFNEVVFFHKPSQTMITTDLVFNLQNPVGFRTMVMTKLFGTYKKTTVSKLFKLMVKNPDAMKASFDKMAMWPTEKIIMSHGEVIKERGAEIFRSLPI